MHIRSITTPLLSIGLSALGATAVLAQPATVIEIGAPKRDAPISKYIYGQFIEHLGRCIYGGIWAEMLEDRKFFYPVTDEFKPWSDKKTPRGGTIAILTGSPWKVVGPAQTVRMVREGAFVGAHTPEITLRHAGGAQGIAQGIAQGELALLKGKRYEGRIVLSGDPAAAPIAISLVWGEGPRGRDTVTVRELSAEFTTTPLRFRSGATTGNARLEIIGLGAGRFRVGAASIMPSDNIQGMRRDTLALLKELNAPVYRWPGGNFVSGYDWRDGVGDPYLRPPRKNPAWAGIEHNDFGIHEFMQF